LLDVTHYTFGAPLERHHVVIEALGTSAPGEAKYVRVDLERKVQTPTLGVDGAEQLRLVSACTDHRTADV
jgi:hypothetical protein